MFLLLNSEKREDFNLDGRFSLRKVTYFLQKLGKPFPYIV